MKKSDIFEDKQQEEISQLKEDVTSMKVNCFFICQALYIIILASQSQIADIE